MNNLGVEAGNTATSRAIKNINVSDALCKSVKPQNTPLRANSEPNLISTKGDRHGAKKRTNRLKCDSDYDVQQFGYEIEDIDDFLTNVSKGSWFSFPVECWNEILTFHIFHLMHDKTLLETIIQNKTILTS